MARRYPKSNEYYFSTPIMFQETDEVRLPVVVITPKARWDTQKAWDCLSEEYQYMASIANNIFGLDKIGFTYNPDLDEGLKDYIKEVEEYLQLRLQYTKQ